MLSNLIIFIFATVVWIAGNIVYGNMTAMAWTGWLQAFPWWLQVTLATMPSSFQLYLEENWNNSEDHPFDSRLTTIGAVMLSVLLDLGLPAVGLLVTAGVEITPVSFGIALVPAFFVSWVCQHIAWQRGKALWRALGQGRPEPPRSRPHPRRKQGNDRRRRASPTLQLWQASRDRE